MGRSSVGSSGTSGPRAEGVKPAWARLAGREGIPSEAGAAARAGGAKAAGGGGTEAGQGAGGAAQAGGHCSGRGGRGGGDGGARGVGAAGAGCISSRRRVGEESERRCEGCPAR